MRPSPSGLFGGDRLMLHSDLIVTLVAAFVAAFVGGMIAVRLGLPPIVGYLIAGVAIGPYTPGGSADPTIALELADVGVILLMFGVGLHFSTRELLAVAPIAVPGALGQSAVATLLGLGVSQIWGWTISEGIILGLCLSVASTIVMLRALEDRNLLDSYAGHVAVGWLIVEDLFTVIILILLPAIADPGGGGKGLAANLGEGTPAVEIALSLAQAGVFVVLMLFVGAKAIPRLLAEVVRAGSREPFTLCILALALGVAFGSSELFGVSLALGAFLAGVVLNGRLSHRASLEALPLRDAFAVVFFVAVGTLFDPNVLIDEPIKVLQVLAIIVIGKSLAAFIIVSGIGYGTRTSLLVAAALGQVGEFSFILAALSISLDVLPAEANSLILAGSILSITLNPFFFRNLDRFERWVRAWRAFADFAQRRYPEVEPELELRRHVVICGYGRTGSNLARSLAGRGLPFVVVENNPYVFERARAAGLTCILGDSTRQDVLEQADLRDARIIAITFDNPGDALVTIGTAKTLNPPIDIVARGLGEDSHALLRRAGAAEVVDPSFETGVEFVRHVLHRYGVDAREIIALQTRWRSEYYRAPD